MGNGKLAMKLLVALAIATFAFALPDPRDGHWASEVVSLASKAEHGLDQAVKKGTSSHGEVISELKQARKEGALLSKMSKDLTSMTDSKNPTTKMKAAALEKTVESAGGTLNEWYAANEKAQIAGITPAEVKKLEKTEHLAELGEQATKD